MVGFCEDRGKVHVHGGPQPWLLDSLIERTCRTWHACKQLRQQRSKPCSTSCHKPRLALLHCKALEAAGINPWQRSLSAGSSHIPHTEGLMP